MDISASESIIKVQVITKLPHAPAFVDGVTNLRGKILPVINLHERFGLPSRETDKNSRIIVININETAVGMIVDGVSEVLTVPEKAVEPAPSITSTVDSSFITGIAKLDGRLVILLDLNQVLSFQETAGLAAIA